MPCYTDNGDGMLNELKIKYFLALSEYLSFSAAARELHISQQALSKQIGQLEQELDCILLTRTSKGVELTDAGQTIEKAFRAIQNTMQRAMVEIHNDLRQRDRVLNIGCAAGLRPGPFFTALYKEFTQKQDAQIWLGQPDTFNDLINWLAEDRFDLVLCTDDYGDRFSEFESVKLCRTPLYFFVGRDSPLASPGALLKDFQDIPFYLPNVQPHSDRILSICAKYHFFPKSLYHTANPYSSHLMVEMGSAVTFGTGFSVLHTDPGIRAYRLPGEEVSLQCLWHPELASALTQEFVAFLCSHCDPQQLIYPAK